MGTWVVDARMPGVAPAADAPVVRSVFEWILGGAYLAQRTSVPIPGVPDSLAIVATEPADGRYTQHYFDSRGVSRLYVMTFDGSVWTLTRRSADFSSFDFAQRFVGTFSAGGDRIEGRWEKAMPGSGWELDFELNYTRDR
ncbi:hypothetical protein [Asanoa sp. NPDC050611]|uniref:hypothetical protein n=1 Tax=Asanoa sp. NPDC050611 TaxID=3157098 RepID=UPI0033E8F3EA